MTIAMRAVRPFSSCVQKAILLKVCCLRALKQTNKQKVLNGVLKKKKSMTVVFVITSCTGHIFLFVTKKREKKSVCVCVCVCVCEGGG